MSAETVADHFHSHIVSGLSDRQVIRNSRLVRPIHDESSAKVVAVLALRQFANPLEYLLLASGVIAWGIRQMRDAYFIFGILIFNAIIGFIQEFKTEQALKALNKIVPKQFKVVRSGKLQEVATDSIVPGDIVVITPGERVPADLRLTQTEELELDESQLTGEAASAAKHSKTIELPGNKSIIQPNMAFYGSLVVGGHGRGIVVAAGRDMRFAKLLSKAQAKKDVSSPLQTAVNKLALIILIGAFAASLIAFVFALGRHMAITEALIYVINLFVAIIPEGLPIVVTIVLTIAAFRMMKSKVVTRKLSSADTLGNIDLILTDKTGTVTTGKMTVRAVWQNEQSFSASDGKRVALIRDDSKVVASDSIKDLALAGALASNASIIYNLRAKRQLGDAVEIALLNFAHGLNISANEVARWRKQAEIPFNSRRRFMAKMVRRGEDERILVKGAPEEILKRAASVMVDGKARRIDQALRDKYNAICKSYAARGMKVLAIAEKKIVGKIDDIDDADIKDLIIMGVVGIEDAPRADIAETIQTLYQGGIETKLVTGDHSSTAYAIAREVGIAGSRDYVVVGSKLNGLIAAHRDNVLRHAKVFARMTPENKLDLVRYFQDKGSYVAVSGDGVNDAAAIKAANIGIAFAGEGRDVAEQTADVVLLDNNFNVLAQGLFEGRTVWQNLRKIVYFLLSTNLAELMVILGSLVFALPLPFTAIQILWINVITDTLADEALAFEPPEGNIIHRHNRKLIDKMIARRIFIAAVWQTLVVFAVYFWAMQKFDSAGAGSIAFFTLVVMQIYNLLNSRSLHKTVFSVGGKRNWWMALAVSTTIILLFASIYFVPLTHFLGLQRFDLSVAISIVLIGLSMIGVVEIDKIICESLRRRR